MKIISNILAYFARLNANLFNKRDIEKDLYGAGGVHALISYTCDTSSLKITIAPFADLTREKKFTFNEILDYHLEVSDHHLEISDFDTSHFYPLDIIGITSTKTNRVDYYKFCIHCSGIELNFVSKWPIGQDEECMSDCCSKNTKNVQKVDLKNLDGLICYCFKKSKKDLFEAAKNGREDSFIDDIKAKMKDLGCFCETANPSGKCCLADIQAFIKAVKK